MSSRGITSKLTRELMAGSQSLSTTEASRKQQFGKDIAKSQSSTDAEENSSRVAHHSQHQQIAAGRIQKEHKNQQSP
jgi:hypothetical protein